MLHTAKGPIPSNLWRYRFKVKSQTIIPVEVRNHMLPSVMYIMYPLSSLCFGPDHVT